MEGRQNLKRALIAGKGILPRAIAERLYDSKTELLILTLRDEFEDLKPYAVKIVHMKTPKLGHVVREIKAFGASELIMAGNIPKKIIYKIPLLFFDKLSRSVMCRKIQDDHSLLGSIVEAFEGENIKVIPYWQILPEFIASKGKLSERSPNNKEMKDVEYACEILRVTLPCSFGQAVCVADGAVVAVEAMEGTDMMINRAGSLSGHGVIVKMMKENQDMRYDIPTVGEKTLEAMKKSGLTCLAVESGKTLILEPEKFFALADKYEIAVLGI